MNAGSTEASLNPARSTDQRSSERISAGRHEADLDQDPDLEEKPRIPLKATTAVTADLDENPDPYITDKDTTKSKSNLSTKSAVPTRSTKKKKKIKAARTKLKAPDSGSEDVHKPRSTIAKDLIEQAYYRKILSKTLLHDPVLAIIQVRQIGDLTGPISKPNTSTDRLNAVKILLDLLQGAGLVAGEFDPDALFEMELGAIQAATQDLYESLKILVGEHVQTLDLNYQTGSSHYILPEPRSVPIGCEVPEITYEQTGSTAKAGPSLSPEKPDRQEERLIPTGRATPTTNSSGSSNKLDEYFQMAMNRFQKEQSLVTVQRPPLGTQDIDMESVGSPDPHSWEYDPDDLGISSFSGHNSVRAAVTSAAIGSEGSSLIQRVRISAISDLKEFTGKDMDAPEHGSARSGNRKGETPHVCGSDGGTSQELAPTVKSDYQDQMGGFTGKFPDTILRSRYVSGMAARKRSEETPLDYLYRLNVAALRAKLKIKDENPKTRREHVDHYIE
ncbi:hypothetical protein PHMEG_00037374, partial [Phytophthora megakarya]